MYKSFFSLILFLLSWQVQAQVLTGIGTVWSDDFSQWIIYTDEGQGELQTRWQGDFSEWDYYIGDTHGVARLKWKNSPTEWEIKGDDGEIITARTRFPRDLREWRITNNTRSVNLSPVWNDMTEWKVQHSAYGTLHISTTWNNDIREWEIRDDTKDMTIHQKMSVVFLVIFHSSLPYHPK